MMATDVGIQNNLANEWDIFINSLIMEGIRLIGKEERKCFNSKILWSYCFTSFYSKT